MRRIVPIAGTIILCFWMTLMAQVRNYYPGPFSIILIVASVSLVAWTIWALPIVREWIRRIK